MKNPTRTVARLTAPCAAFALTAFFSHSATGQVTTTYHWLGEDEPGPWANAENWLVDEAPTTSFPSVLSDEALVDRGGTPIVKQGDIIEIGRLFVGGAGGSFLNIETNGMLNSRQIRIGSDQVGTVVNNGGYFETISQSLESELEPAFIIGIEGGGVGTYTQTAGQLTATATRFDNSRPDFLVGAFGATGVFNLEGGDADIYNLRIGFANPEGIGGGTVNHSGGTLTHRGDFAIGWAHPNGTYHLSGDGVLSLPLGNDRVRIGATGLQKGLFRQSGGTADIAARFEIGTEGGAQGTLQMEGGNLNITNDILVGAFDSGTSGIILQTGGAIVVNRVRVGIADGTSGEISLNGGSITTNVMYVENPTATGSLSFNGGTVIATGGGNFIYGFPSVTLGAEGATINSNEQGIDITPPVIGTGGLTKSGGGYVNLVAPSNYRGNTVITQGVLRLNTAGRLNPASNVEIPSTGANLELNFTGMETVNRLIVDGISMPEGIYGSDAVAGSHIPVSYITGTGFLKVEPAAGYDSWASNPANGLAENERDPDFDADGDGLTNLMEYALGGNPKSGTSEASPKITVTNGDIQFTFNRSADSSNDTSAFIQWSTDLNQWLPENQIEVTTSGPISVPIPAGQSSNGKLFARLKVLRN